MERLRAALDAAGDSDSGATRAETLERARQLFEIYVSDCKSQPQVARFHRMVDEMRRHFEYFEYVEAVVNGRVSLPSNTPCLFDPLVRWLLSQNYSYAVETAGRDAAKAELLDFVKALTQGTRGRPATIPVQRVQEARRLWDTGMSFGQIGKTLGLGSGSRVRTALRHHFPDRFAVKKSN